MYYIRVKEGKNETLKKEGKMRIIGEKEKIINKGTDKQYVAVVFFLLFFVTQYN